MRHPVTDFTASEIESYKAGLERLIQAGENGLIEIEEDLESRRHEKLASIVSEAEYGDEECKREMLNVQKKMETLDRELLQIKDGLLDCVINLWSNMYILEKGFVVLGNIKK